MTPTTFFKHFFSSFFLFFFSFFFSLSSPPALPVRDSADAYEEWSGGMKEWSGGVKEWSGGMKEWSGRMKEWREECGIKKAGERTGRRAVVLRVKR